MKCGRLLSLFRSKCTRPASWRQLGNFNYLLQVNSEVGMKPDKKNSSSWRWIIVKTVFFVAAIAYLLLMKFKMHIGGPVTTIDVGSKPDFMPMARLVSHSHMRDTRKKHHDNAVRPHAATSSPHLESKLTFYLIFSTSANNSLSINDGTSKRQSGKFNWRHWRTVESIFYHHPTAEVKVYSNTLPDDMFNVLTAAGYSIQVQGYSLKTLLVGTPAEGFIAKLETFRKSRFWYVHVADLLRLVLLYQYGGIYMDTDIIVVRPLESLKWNSPGWQDKRKINNAFLKFEKGNSFLEACLKEFSETYKENVFGFNGPDLLTRVYRASNWSPDVVSPVGYKLYYMIRWNSMNKQCFTDTEGDAFDANMRILKNEAYVVHLNSKLSGNKGIAGDVLKDGTICKHLLTSFCVICDNP